jgi:Xaa-Pro aminopeptidase
LILIDCGCEYLCYPSNNTQTIPANGVFFSEEQKKVYQAVFQNVKPGVPWPDMTILSAKVMAQSLVDAGLFQNPIADEIVEKDILAAFWMNGLGNSL